MGYTDVDVKITTSAVDESRLEKKVLKVLQEYSGYYYFDIDMNFIDQRDVYEGLYDIFHNIDELRDYYYYPYREDFEEDDEGECEYQEAIAKYEEVHEEYPHFDAFSNSSMYVYDLGSPYIKCTTERKEISDTRYLPFDYDTVRALFKNNKGKKFMIIKKGDRYFQNVRFGDDKLKECTDYCKEQILNGEGAQYYVINRSVTKVWIICGSERSKNKSRYHIFGHFHI